MKLNETTLKLCEAYNHDDMRLDDALQTAYDEGFKQGKRLQLETSPNPEAETERLQTIGVKSWDVFRATGLLFFINNILHAFGWAIVVETTDKKVTGIYPARVKYRGFDEASQMEEHTKIAAYLAENAPKFPEEIK